MRSPLKRRGKKASSLLILNLNRSSKLCYNNFYASEEKAFIRPKMYGLMYKGTIKISGKYFSNQKRKTKVSTWSAMLLN